MTHVTCRRDTLHGKWVRNSGNSDCTHCRARAKLEIDAASSYFRVGIEPARTGAGATVGLRAFLLEARGMCDATDSISLRSDEHGRQRYSSRHCIRYVVLLCLKGTTLGIAIQSGWPFSGGTYRSSRPNGRRSTRPALAACLPLTGSLASPAAIPSLHILDLRLS